MDSINNSVGSNRNLGLNSKIISKTLSEFTVLSNPFRVEHKMVDSIFHIPAEITKHRSVDVFRNSRKKKTSGLQTYDAILAEALDFMTEAKLV